MPTSLAIDVVAQPRLVLIVEDELPVRRLAAESIAMLGYRTIEAGCAADAMAILESTPGIDMLFTDVRMPGAMNGAELAFTVRSRWPKMAIIVVSGNFDPKASRLPMGTAFLPKPYRFHELDCLLNKQFAR